MKEPQLAISEPFGACERLFLTGSSQAFASFVSFCACFDFVLFLSIFVLFFVLVVVDDQFLFKDVV